MSTLALFTWFMWLLSRAQHLKYLELTVHKLAMYKAGGDINTVRVEGHLKILQDIECPSEVMCCRFHAEGLILAVGFVDGYVRIYDPESGKVLHSLYDDDTRTLRQPVTSIQFKPAGSDEKIERQRIVMVSYASGFVKLWHFTSGKCLATLNEESRQTLYATVNNDGTKFVTGGDNCSLNMYDIESMKLLKVFQASDSRAVMNGHRSRVFAIKYHPNYPTQFISGGWDDTIQFWDERSQHSTRKISGHSGPHICGDALDIDAIHNHILTGSWRTDKVLQIWDYNSGDKIKDCPPDPLQKSQLYCAQWLGREMLTCGGCDSNMAKIIDRGTLNTIGQLVDLPHAVYCIDNTRSGHNPKVAIGSANMVYIVKQDKL